MLKTTKGQTRLRLVVDNEERKTAGGYMSGRSRWRETPDADSIARTRSAGTRPDASQPEIVPCDLKPRHRAKALCPPTALQASRSASVDIRLINAQSDNLVNAKSGNAVTDNYGMPKRAVIPASPFWKRLEEALGANPNWQPLNPNSLATKLKMSQGSVHRWYAGVGFPEMATALELSKAGGVCVDWLLNSVKPKYPISKDPVLRSLFEICEDLPADARAVVLRAAEGEQLRKQQADFIAAETARKKA